MEKILKFFKHYLSEMLFVFVASLTILGAIYCIPYHDHLSTITMVAVVIIQMAFTEFLKSRYPNKSFKTMYFTYIVLFSSIMTLLSLFADNIYTLLGVTLVLLGDVLDRYRRDQEALEFEEKYPFSRDIDILCETDDGRRIRLPFKKRFLGNPIGIFPFKNEPEYIELREFSEKNQIDKYVKGSLLMDIDFCERIAKIREQLNLCLKELDAPKIEGEYYAENSYMHGYGSIASFEKDCVSRKDYDGQNSVKFRMIGKFYEESKNLK